MEYITVHEAAERWKVSERMVQKYCAQGRIPGAKKFGISWGIPLNARKPENFRKGGMKYLSGNAVEKTEVFSDLMPLMNAAYEPGHCMEYIESMEEGTQKEIALAEYYYFKGCPEKAVEKAELYLNSKELASHLSACLIYAYSNLSIGQIHRAKYALSEVRHMLLTSDENTPLGFRAAEAFIAATAAVLLHLPLPEGMPPMEDYLYFLPPGLQSFALYVYAHYTYLQGEYEKSLGIVETTLALQAIDYPISGIYLHLAAVMDYTGLRQMERAKEHLLAAWDLAKPDDMMEAFGEHHGLVGGMLEAVIKKDWPEDFRRIISITNRFSEGWRKVHNPLTGHEVADNLTTSEFSVAMLAARGWTNQEIGEHMNISPNTVKHYVSVVLQKLNIRHRKELKKYMLQ